MSEELAAKLDRFGREADTWYGTLAYKHAAELVRAEMADPREIALAEARRTLKNLDGYLRDTQGLSQSHRLRRRIERALGAIDAALRGAATP